MSKPVPMAVVAENATTGLAEGPAMIPLAALAELIDHAELVQHLVRSALDTEHHTPEARDIARGMVLSMPGGKQAYARAVLEQAEAEQARSAA